MLRCAAIGRDTPSINSSSFAERNTIFGGIRVIASTISDVLWIGEGDPQRLRGNYGTFNTFDVMGVPPLFGRTPTAEDARPGAPPVVVLGYRFWQRQFAGDPNVLGCQLQLNDTSSHGDWRHAEAIHVARRRRLRPHRLRARTHGSKACDPSICSAAQTRRHRRAGGSRSPADRCGSESSANQPSFPTTFALGFSPSRRRSRAGSARDVWFLFGAVAVLLLIACVNVSNLILSRAQRHGRRR